VTAADHRRQIHQQMNSKIPNLTEEARKKVADILLELQGTDYSGTSTTSIDATSVLLRKLLLDGGTGHYGSAWSLLRLPEQPLIRASDLDAALERSKLSDESVIWIEAPVAKPQTSGFDLVTDSSKFIPPGLREPILKMGHTGNVLHYEVISADGAVYFWGYAPSTGSVIATKFEPPAGTQLSAEQIAGSQARFRWMTLGLARKIERDFTLQDLRGSTAIAVGAQRLTRQNAIGFIANRRGAHIDPSTPNSFRHQKDALREAQYSKLRNIPSWANELHVAFGQVRSIAQFIASSPDTEQFLNHWENLPPRPQYWHP
jgi:hypothetical protein